MLSNELHLQSREEVNHFSKSSAGMLAGISTCVFYIASDFGPDALLHNLSVAGHLRFERLFGKRTRMAPASKVLGHDSFKGIGVDCGDLNYDGIADLVVSNITSEFALEESNLVFLNTGNFNLMRAGIAPYREASEPLGSPKPIS